MNSRTKTCAVFTMPKIKEKLVMLLFMWGLLFSVNASESIFYVKKGADGDGTSWQKAFGDLQQALNDATYGTEIWVSTGIYYPTKGTDRFKSFVIPDGVKLFGGFKGNEQKKDYRKVDLYKTILSGDIGSDDNKDNTYNVIYTKNVSSDTEVNGFYIANGYAMDNKSVQNDPTRSGAGWYNVSQKQSSSPVIKNCFFIGNKAVDGGAIYNNATGGKTEMVIINCYFIDNEAVMDGGAFYNDCHFKGYSKVIFEDCTFEKNESNNGACIFNYSFNGYGHGEILNSKFQGNKARMRGGVVYNGSKEERLFDINNCNFLNNTAVEGSKFFNIAEKEKQRTMTVNYNDM